MLATVVLCDIRDSRKISDRQAFAAQVSQCLDALNEQPDDLIAKFAVQAGIDEFAGIVTTPASGRIMQKLWFGLYPQAVRCSVVVGDLDIQAIANDVDQPPAVYHFDGPAFHQAADQLAAMQQTGQLFCYHHANLETWQSELISALGDQLYAQMLGWTRRQHEIVREYTQRDSQSAAARHLGIDQSAISHSLSAMDYSRFRRNLGLWQACFDEI
ncbi:SatD family protein [Vreelandella aquamarina]|uniref:SatD family protein n=1 Tax=Vreelandella aquamarina TaxID=77097 RepID=UPI00384FC5B3